MKEPVPIPKIDFVNNAPPDPSQAKPPKAKKSPQPIHLDEEEWEPDGPITASLDKELEEWFPMMTREELNLKAIQQSRAIQNYTTIIQERLERENLKIRKFWIEIHNRWMLPFSCLLFLFLGAPLGAIIRKGGIGVPVLASIGFFILFYLFMIQGKKFAKSDYLPVWAGVWLPFFVMTPMALLFTWSSATDSPILYKAGWWKIMRFLFGWIRRKKAQPESETQSIEDLIREREMRKDRAKRRFEDYQKEQGIKIGAIDHTYLSQRLLDPEWPQRRRIARQLFEDFKAQNESPDPKGE